MLRDGLHARFLAAHREVRHRKLFDPATHLRIQIRGQRHSGVRFAENFHEPRGAETLGRQRAVELGDEFVARQPAALEIANHMRKASHLCKATQLR